MLPLSLLLPPLIALTASQGAQAAAPQDQERAAVQRAADAAIEAVRQGDYQGARRILADLIVVDNLARAKELLARAGEVADAGESAMILLDEALELDPNNPQLLHHRGRAAYVAAEASTSNPRFFYEDSLEYFLEANRRGVGFEVAFEASRAARRIPDPDLALELARWASKRLASADPRPTIDPPAERTHAQAAFDVFIAKRNAGEEGAEFFLEAEAMLARRLGRTPEDPWPRMQLANLYQWNDEVPRSIEQLQLALAVAPEEQALHDRLMQLAGVTQGWQELVDWYEDFQADHPDSANVVRNTGVVSFYEALARFDAGEFDHEAFLACEDWFEEAASLDPAWQQDCLGYRVIARCAAGWCHFNQGEMTAAKEAFLSMDTLLEGGLAWGLPGRLPDGIAGLGFVIQRLVADPTSLSAMEDMVEAAAIASYLHSYLPEDGTHANNAGFILRDTAVLFQRQSLVVANRARQAEDAERRTELEREAQRLLARAREVMEGSDAAYRVAARILSDDVRVVNDTGLVIVYYTRREPDVGETYLLSAVEMGAEQLRDQSLSPEDRYALNEAWGDAHQNMAVLELTIRRRPQLARQWLEKALEIGPASREPMRALLPICDAMAEDPRLDLGQTYVRNLVWLSDAPR